MVRIVFILMLFASLGACATTNLHVAEPQANAEGEPTAQEKQFFEELSAQDDALAEATPVAFQKDPEKNQGCTCPVVASKAEKEPEEDWAEGWGDDTEEEAKESQAANTQPNPTFVPQPVSKPEEESYFDIASNNETPAARTEKPKQAKHAEEPPMRRVQVSGETSPPADQNLASQEEESFFQEVAVNQTQESGDTTTTPALTQPQEQFHSNTGDGQFDQIGTASWYGRDFDGRKTANGEIFDSRKLTAAHREIPLGSIVLVKNLENGREVIVTVNDRGPYVHGRVLDASEFAAEKLDYKEKGLTTVGIKILRRGKGEYKGDTSRKGLTYEYYPDPTEARKQSETRPPQRKVARKPETQKEETKPKPKPASYDTEDALSSFSVQAGLFSEEDNAKTMHKMLSHYSEPVYIFQRGAYYVVKIGKFDSRPEAEQLRERLTDDGYETFLSVP